MDAETWYTPQQALKAKLVDHVDANTKRDSAAQDRALASAARWDLSAYSNAPKPGDIVRQPDLAALAEKTAAQLHTNRNRMRLLSPI